MKFLNGESTPRALAFGFALALGGRSALGLTSALAFTSTLGFASALGFTIGLAFALVFALGFAADFAAVGFAAAVFFRIFAAISVVRSSPKHWLLVVRARGPLNEGRVRYQKISAMATGIVGSGRALFGHRSCNEARVRTHRKSSRK